MGSAPPISHRCFLFLFFPFSFFWPFFFFFGLEKLDYNKVIAKKARTRMVEAIYIYKVWKVVSRQPAPSVVWKFSIVI